MSHRTYPVAAALRRHLCASRLKEEGHADHALAVGTEVLLALVEAGITHDEAMALGQALGAYRSRKAWDQMQANLAGERSDHAPEAIGAGGA